MDMALKSYSDMMNTTIQVDMETKKILEKVKNAYKTKTYDGAIRALLKKKTPSLYGSLAKDKKIFLKDIVKGLRYEDDRV